MNHALQAMKDRGERLRKLGMPKMPEYAYRGQDEKDPSLVTRACETFAKPDRHYTGDAMLGISQTHKSNAVPVFNTEHIVEIGMMRR